MVTTHEESVCGLIAANNLYVVRKNRCGANIYMVIVLELIHFERKH